MYNCIYGCIDWNRKCKYNHLQIIFSLLFISSRFTSSICCYYLLLFLLLLLQLLLPLILLPLHSLLRVTILLVSLHALSSLTPSQSINAILPLLCKYAKHRLIMQCLSPGALPGGCNPMESPNLPDVPMRIAHACMFPISDFQFQEFSIKK